MKNQFKVLCLLVLISILFLLTFCKKDDENLRIPEIDLTEANIRVAKVEVKQNTFNFPFTSETLYTIYYEYIDQSFRAVVDMEGYFSRHNFLVGKWLTPEQMSVEFIWPELTQNMIIDRKYFGYFPVGSGAPTAVRRPTTSQIWFDESQIAKIEDSYYSTIDFSTGNGFSSQYRAIDLEFQLGLLNSLQGAYDYLEGNDHLIKGNGVKLSEVTWEDGLVKSYAIRETLNKYWPWGDLGSLFPEAQGLILTSPKVGINFNVTLQYTEALGVPKMLLRMVNQSLGNLLPTALSDYIITHHSLFDEDSYFWKNFGDDIPKPTTYFNNDWILTFADPRLTVLPEQVKIISSKTIQGQYLSNIASNQPVYKTINTTATFPYTHDPVAKTLEIAGLKIWYEVVE
jgi:hypothetical protein